MFFRTVTDMQNRLIRIAGGLLIALSLLSCSTFENQPPLTRPPIEILLTINPGQGTIPNRDACKFSPLSNVIITPPRPKFGSDLIGFDPNTGEIDLYGLKVVPHTPAHPSRHVDIIYRLDTPSSIHKEYSFYFTNDNTPLVPKDGDPHQPKQILKVYPFSDGATSVKVKYQNVYKERYETFKFYITYTIVQTDSRGDKTSYIGVCDDPNIKNTPV